MSQHLRLRTLNTIAIWVVRGIEKLGELEIGCSRRDSRLTVQPNLPLFHPSILPLGIEHKALLGRFRGSSSDDDREKHIDSDPSQSIPTSYYFKMTIFLVDW